MGFSRNNHSIRGFSLLEMGIVLMIVSAVVGGGAAMLTKKLEMSQIDETNQKMVAIKKALLDYRRTNNRIPCPANAEVAISHANFGVEATTAGTCTGAIAARTDAAAQAADGMVPVRTLKLPDTYAFDGWGRRFTYAVDLRYTNTDGFTTYDKNSGGRLKVNPDIVEYNFGNTASYVGADSSTLGNWQSKYGTLGYVLPRGHSYSSQSYIPPGATSSAGSGGVYTAATGYTVQPASNGHWTWVAEGTATTDVGRLLIPGSTSNRMTACWYSSASSFTISISVPSDVKVKVSLYSYGYDSGRKQYITFSTDPANPVKISTEFINTNAVYNTWNISGNNTVTIALCTVGVCGVNGSVNSVISGVFFDKPTYHSLGAAYVLVSHGKNGHGAYPKSGGSSRVNIGSTNAAENSNCHCNSSAATGTLDFYFYEKPASVDLNTATNSYDDIVTHATRADLTLSTE